VVLLGGLSIHALEPDAAPTVGDGMWWAAATLSTVGYGDIAPKTLMGRALAVVIMVVGVSTFAILTAGIASLFVRDERVHSGPELEALRADIADIRWTIQSLAAQTAPERSQQANPPPTNPAD